MDYWRECVRESLDNARLMATDEQIDTITSWVEGAHENYSEANGYDAIPNPAAIELARVKSELVREKDKIICTECNGRGYIVWDGPSHSGESTCSRCNGDGRTDP